MFVAVLIDYMVDLSVIITLSYTLGKADYAVNFSVQCYKMGKKILAKRYGHSFVQVVAINSYH